MPPKVAKAEKAEKSAAPKAEEALNPESKLMWAVLCELSKEGKIAGINWEEVKGPIEATTGHAARQRWDVLKKKMQTRGSELPASRAPGEAKAKVTKPKAPKKEAGVKKPRGKKAKEAAEAAEAAAKEEAQGSGGEGEEETQDANGEDAVEDESS